MARTYRLNLGSRLVNWIFAGMTRAGLIGAGLARAGLTGRRSVAVRLQPRALIALTLASLIGLVAFLWPFLVAPGKFGASFMPPLIFGVLLLLVLAVVFAEIADGGIDSKALAMLGVLSAVNAALRPLGAGTAGVDWYCGWAGSDGVRASAGPPSFATAFATALDGCAGAAFALSCNSSCSIRAFMALSSFATSAGTV